MLHISKFKDDYWTKSKAPLQSLLFLLPMVALYEFGTLQLSGKAIYHNSARQIIGYFFEWFNVLGYHLPSIVLIAVLIGLHFTKKDKITLAPKTQGWMLIESMLFALPLLVLALIITKPNVIYRSELGLPLEITLSLGAGIYEELLFRLIAIAIFHAIFFDLLALPRKWGDSLSVGAAILLFALYHFSSDGYNFNFFYFLIYIFYGIYFTTLYMTRGFGIAAGVHAFFDVYVTLYNHSS